MSFYNMGKGGQGTGTPPARVDKKIHSIDSPPEGMKEKGVSSEDHER